MLLTLTIITQMKISLVELRDRGDIREGVQALVYSTAHLSITQILSLFRGVWDLISSSPSTILLWVKP